MSTGEFSSGEIPHDHDLSKYGPNEATFIYTLEDQDFLEFLEKVWEVCWIEHRDYWINKERQC